MKQSTDMDSVEEIRENWKRRIIAECESMHQAIESLRAFAAVNSDADFVKQIEHLHDLYCSMANSITLRLLINGVIETQGCDDTIGTGRESAG